MSEKFDGTHYCTIIGHNVPLPNGGEGVVRIGSGNIFLELLPSGKASIHGAKGDEAVEAVLTGIRIALSQNPYYIVPEAG